MSDNLKESADRLAASRIVPNYFRFKGVNLKEMYAEVAEAGAENTNLEVHLGLHEDGTPEAWLKVVHLDAEGKAKPGGGTYNVSETCPPKCDGG